MINFEFKNKQKEENPSSESSKEKIDNKLQETNKNDDLVFNFKEEPSDLNLKNTIIEIYKTKCIGLPLTEIVGKIKTELDLKIPKGWIVFAGSDMVGACSYIENTLVEFKIDKISFVIFQTYCPV